MKTYEMKRLIWLACLLAGFTSCSLLESDEARVDFRLFGRWIWVQSQAEGQTPVTPETLGEEVMLIFYPDFTYTLYRNNSELARGCFRLHAGKSVSDRNKESRIEMNPQNWMKDVVLCGLIRVGDGGKLVISENGPQGQISLFKR